jgi:ribosome-binding protein aMBF1 (putative translation factor)
VIGKYLEEVMILCDLCGQAKECLQKEIDGKEFDICADCWRPLEEKLRGKGRVKKTRGIVFLPPPTVPEREPEEPRPMPGQPPKIFGGAERAN